MAGFLGASDSKLIRACLTVRPHKFTLEHTTKAEKWSTGIALLFNLDARRGWVVNPTPGRFTPRISQYLLLYRRLGRPQDRSGLIVINVAGMRVGISAESDIKYCPKER
jgi:hypothetical protein